MTFGMAAEFNYLDDEVGEVTEEIAKALNLLSTIDIYDDEL
ncbi:unnamed protein product [uncultured virus]|nr:unnamed protein product [uncultured virus]